VGRFGSIDPIPPSNSGFEPQAWNRYSYTLGDPVNFFDPNGLLTIIVHGSFATNPDWAKEDSEFFQEVKATFGETPILFQWSGIGVTELTGYAGIYAGGVSLANFINSYLFSPGESLNIVAFSHGGNVANVASYLIGRQIDSLVNLATPQNMDLPDLSYFATVKNYCNAFSLTDPVQFLGASSRQIIMTGYHAVYGELYARYAWEEFLKMNYSMAEYFASLSAKFIAISADWYLSTKVNLRANNVMFALGSHGDLHSSDYWT
jgi:hypothetical protein